MYEQSICRLRYFFLFISFWGLDRLGNRVVSSVSVDNRVRYEWIYK